MLNKQILPLFMFFMISLYVTASDDLISNFFCPQLCPPGSLCENLKCVAVQSKRCVTNAKKIFCDRPPLIPQDCPTIDGAPNLICGVDKSGKQTGYQTACDACKDKRSIFYYDQPCEKLKSILCLKDQMCVDGKCVQLDRCKGKCLSWEYCSQAQRKCRDRCDFLKCANCFRGQCNIDKCSLIRCRAGFKCIDGKCFKNDPCDVIICIPESKCINGRCVSLPYYPCGTTKCPLGHSCNNGICIPPKGLCGGRLCVDGFTCENGKCIAI